MAKLILSLNSVVQAEHELTQERIAIGRKPDNDIQIDNLAVSGRHAVILTILDDSFLEDQVSTNGTYVNGRLTKKHALKHGDIISIGKHELKYINENATMEEEDDFEKTMIIKPGSATAAVASARVAENAGVAPTNLNQIGSHRNKLPLGRLTILNGPIAGKELELTKALITLGKPGTQVAVISRRPQGYFLTHIESDGNGKRYPIVNGQAIGPKAYKMEDLDLIELAGIKMEFSQDKP